MRIKSTEHLIVDTHRRDFSVFLLLLEIIVSLIFEIARVFFLLFVIENNFSPHIAKIFVHSLMALVVLFHISGILL